MAIKFQFPTGQYLLNLAIGLAIVTFAMKFIPEKYKSYFRV